MAERKIASDYKINRGDTLKIDTGLPITAVYDGTLLSEASVHSDAGDTFPVQLKLFGAIPLTEVNVEVVDEMYVSVLGNPFGMKLYTDGVLVIDLTSVDTKKGSVSPAKDAGVRTGDYILSANGTEVTCNEDLCAVVERSGGKPVRLKIMRSGKTVSIKVTPQLSVENAAYRIGLWVRDSSAGIGTLTFYSPTTGVLCGLGHGICDADTGSLLTVESGQMVSAQIVSVAKGTAGNPGELKGRLTYETLAQIDENCDCGVYGFLKGRMTAANLTEIALKQEVKNGAAQILCTVDGGEPKLYSCTVKKRNSTYLSKTQNMTVTVTDKRLLQTTGGIVQGMSGSPVLQNGRLIGAITHVLVDDPTTGYAIFAENMLETAQGVASENKLKDAS